jgi:primosomal protein N' (replication factor Y) (superfamily II helicase)
MAEAAGPETFALVAVNRPVFGAFHYRIPESLKGRLEKGSRVSVPFGHGRAAGVCVGFDEGPPPITADKVKPVTALVDPEPLYTEETLGLAAWMARYYLCPLGEVLASFLPGGVARAQRAVQTVRLAPDRGDPQAEAEALARRAPCQAALLRLLADTGDLPLTSLRAEPAFSPAAYRTLTQKGWIQVLHGPASGPLPGTGDPVPHGPRPELTRDQVAAVQAIQEADGFAPFLLHGVTGSGKTEVYLRAISDRVDRGHQAVILVPEIALTPQTVDRFRERFQRVAVLHSALTSRERCRAWLAIRHGDVDVVIGARSAVFAPAPRLGILVVDEEHEPTFKQQNTPRYNARDLAVKRAQMLGIPVVLGSATPSIETFHNACHDRYRLLRLPKRVTGQPLPTIEVVDLTQDLAPGHRSISIVGRTLMQALEETLSRSEQAMLFLNRRGFHTVCICPACGTPVRCPHCDLTLTYHKKRGLLLCHTCEFTTTPPERCPECGQDEGLKFFGLGTERIEETLGKLFPGARIARMDSDTMTRPESYRETLAAFRARRIDLLVGTQMIAKGLDFPGVTLVGVISADTALAIADFRASERTFQLLTQVAGRAGRGSVRGRVIVQSLDTRHYAITTACQQDYEAFAARELEARQAYRLPPFCRLLRVLLSARDENRLRQAARTAAEVLHAMPPDGGLEILGPVPTPVYKLRNDFRYHALVKADRPDGLRRAFEALESAPPGWRRGVRLRLDVDPMGLG